MGGKSARSRDNYMEALIEQHIDEGGSPRGVTRLAEAAPAAATNWWGGREEQARPVDPPADLPSRAEAAEARAGQDRGSALRPRAQTHPSLGRRQSRARCRTETGRSPEASGCCFGAGGAAAPGLCLRRRFGE